MSITRHEYLLVAAFLSLLLFSSITSAEDDDDDNNNNKKKNTKEIKNVSYDARSLSINGKRELLFSGSIHYPRSTPDMWPDIIAKSKQGGLNVIQTYVFWNVHEPEKGKYNFEERFDLVKFLRTVQEQGMYATIRLGPFIQAEWNHGGLPYWLREVPDIIFRSYNEPFMNHMEKFIKMIIKKLKDAKLFAPQGGPIILAQIENEYNTVQLAYRDLGLKYVQWAGNFALGLDVGVPWVMCKQRDAPDPVINTCNGRHCGDTFIGPNKPNKPSLWTENWTAQFRVFGDPPSQRSAEDTAFSVARWFSKNGSLVNYYMYHGGTNLERTAASFVTTRYYDEAPLDEFGLVREPKYGHLRDLHNAIKLSKKALLFGNPVTEKLGPDQEARVYEQPGECAAFLTNNDTKKIQTINFRGKQYLLPPRSISILPDCQTVVYNSMRIVSQHNARNFVRSEKANKNLKWEMVSEVIPSNLDVTSKQPKELYGLTKDTTDYAWYTTLIILDSWDLSMRKDILPVLRVASLGHAMLAFVNGEFVGSAHGSQIEKSFVLQAPVKLKPGVNMISFLGTLVGLPDSGAYMEHRFAGPRGVTILGLNTGTLDLSNNGWGHEVGLLGEREKWFSEEGQDKAKWKEIPEGKTATPPLTWFKAQFDAPEGDDPVAVHMKGMKKGMIWINGFNIGRYWMSYVSPLGESTQSEYHIPRSKLKEKDNLIVVMEEEGAHPAEMEILTVNRDTICSFVTENHPPNVKSFARKNSKFISEDNVKPAAHLICPEKKKISAIQFASFGDPYGACGAYALGTCNAPSAKQVAEQHCLGKTMCEIPIERQMFDKETDGCPNIEKILAVQAVCT